MTHRGPPLMTNVETSVMQLKFEHRDTWQEKPDWFWAIGLFEEICELLFSLMGLHPGPVEWELTQISAIAMNWLEMRRRRAANAQWG